MTFNVIFEKHTINENGRIIKRETLETLIVNYKFWGNVENFCNRRSTKIGANYYSIECIKR